MFRVLHSLTSLQIFFCRLSIYIDRNRNTNKLIKRYFILVSDKALLFMARTIEKCSLCVKGKMATTSLGSGWIAVQRLLGNVG